MSTFLTEVRETLVPVPTGRYGPLPPLLVAMTVVTGLVDSFSYLLLGHVFVANMTGNVVFLGFAVAGSVGLLDRGIARGAGIVRVGIGPRRADWGPIRPSPRTSRRGGDGHPDDAVGGLGDPGLRRARTPSARASATRSSSS